MSETQRQIEENRKLVEAENKRLADEAAKRQADAAAKQAEKEWR